MQTCEPRPATGVFRALRARSVQGVSPKTGGFSEGVSDGVSPWSFGPRARERPKWTGVPRVSLACPGHLFDTPKHSRDTFGTPVSPGPKGPRRHLWDTRPDTPHFWGTLSGTLPGHSRPEGPERLLWQARGFANADFKEALCGNKSSCRRSRKVLLRKGSFESGLSSCEVDALLEGPKPPEQVNRLQGGSKVSAPKSLRSDSLKSSEKVTAEPFFCARTLCRSSERIFFLFFFFLI